MIHKTISLGLAFVAMLAIGAALASSASAAGAFTGEAGKTITSGQVNGSITGKVTNKFELTTNAGTFKCEVVTFDGALPAAVSTEQTVTPTFNNCNISGTIPVVSTSNGCNSYSKQATQ